MTDFPRGLSDTVTRNDNVIKILIALRTILESSGFTVTGFSTSGFTLSPSNFIQDNTGTDLNKKINDTTTNSDGVGGDKNLFGHLRSAVESITRNSVVGRVTNFFRNQLESKGFDVRGFTEGFTLQGGVQVQDNAQERKGGFFADLFETSGFTLTGFTGSGFFTIGGVFIGDSIRKDVSLNILPNTTVLSDMVAKKLDFIRNQLFEDFPESEQLTRLHNVVRNIIVETGFTVTGFTLSGFVKNEGLHPLDSLMFVPRITNAFRTISESAGFTISGFTEGFYKVGGVFVSDVIGKAVGKQLDDTTIVSDVAGFISDKFRSVTENTVVSNILSNIRGLVRKIDAGSFTRTGFTLSGFVNAVNIEVTDGLGSVFRLANFVRNILEAGGFTTGFSPFGFIIGGVGINDIVLGSVGRIRTINTGDTIIISDMVTGVLNFFGNLRYTMETITRNDVVGRMTVAFRGVLEAGGFTGSGFTLTGFLSGGAGMSDIITGIQDRPRGIADGVTGLLDIVDRMSRLNRGLFTTALDEIITTNDSVIRQFESVWSIAENITISDPITRMTVLNTTLSNTIALTDDIIMGFGVGILENPTINDVVDRVNNAFNVILDTPVIGVSDFVTRNFDKFREANETISPSSMVVGIINQFGIFRPIAENIILSDPISRILGSMREMFDSYGFTISGFTDSGFVFRDGATTDIISGVTNGQVVRIILESSGFSLSGFTDTGFYKNGGVFVSDIATRMLTASRSINDTTVLSDILGRLVSFLPTTMETITTNDMVVRLSNITRIISEASGFTFTGFTLSGFTKNYGINVVDIIDNQQVVTAKFRSIAEISGFTGSGFTLSGFRQGGVTILDMVNKGVTEIITDSSITTMDSVTGLKNFFGIFRNLAEDVTGVQSFIARTIGGVRDIFETRGFTISGFSISGFTLPTTQGGGVIFLSDAMAFSSNKLRIIDEAFENFDLDFFDPNFFGTTNAISVVDNVIAKTSNIRTLFNTVVQSEIFSRVLDLFRNIDLVSGFTFTGFTASGFVMNPLQEMEDNVERSIGKIATILDSSPFLLDQVVKSAQANILMYINETVVLSDDIVRKVDLFRDLLEIRGFTWSGFTNSGFYKQGGVLIEDTVGRLTNGDLFRNITEASGFTLSGFTLDGFTHGGGVFVSDVVSRMQTLNVSIGETVLLSGITNRVISVFRNISEPVINVTSDIVRLMTEFRIILEESGFTATGFTEGFVKYGGIAISDIVVPVKHTGNLFRTIFESSGYTLTGFTGTGFLHNGGVFINDSIQKNVSKLITNTITNNDTVGRVLNPVLRTISEGGISLFDSIIRKVDFNRIISVINGFTISGFTNSGFVIDQGVVVVDVNAGMIRIGNFFREVIEGSGFSITGFTDSGFVKNGGVAISDLIIPRYQSLYRVVTNSVILSDVVAEIKNQFGFLRPITDTVVVSNIIDRKLVMFRTILESRGFTFTGFTLSGFELGGGGVFISDVTEGIKGIIRDIDEGFEGFDFDFFDPDFFGSSYAIVVSDNIIGEINKFGFIRNVAESINPMDNISRLLESARTLVEVQGFVSTGFTASGFFLQGGAGIFDAITGIRDQDYFRTILESSGFTLSGFTTSGFVEGGGVFISDNVERLQLLARNTSENISIIDVVIKEQFAGVVENIALNDIVDRVANFNRIVTSTRGFIISGFTASGFTMEDTMPIIDTIQISKRIGNFFRTINEVSAFTKTGFTASGFLIQGGVQISDIFSKGVGKPLVNNITVIDNITNFTNFPVSIAESVISLSEGIGRIVSFNRAIAEFRAFTGGFTLSGFIGGGVTIQETLLVTKRLGNFFRTMSEFSGYTSSGFTGTGFVINGGILIQDTIVDAVRGAPRAINDGAITVNDNISRLLQNFRTIFNTVFFEETVFDTSFTDKVIGFTDFPPVVLSDQVERQIDLLRVLTNNTVVNDVLSGIADIFVSISENIVISNIISRKLDNLRSVSENITRNDNVVRMLTMLRTMTENTVVSNIISRMLTILRTIADGVTISPDNVTGIRDVPRNIFNIISRDDSIVRMLTMLRTVSNTVVIPVENIVRALGLTRLIANTIVVSNIIDRNIVLLRTVTNNVVVSNIIDRVLDNFRSISETIVIPVEGIVRLLGLTRILTNNVIVSNIIDRNIVLLRAVSENIVVSNIIDRVLDVFRNISSSVTQVGNDFITFNTGRIINDVIPRSDVIDRTLDMFRITSNPAVVLSDDVIRVLDNFRTLAENIIVSNIISRNLVVLRTIANTVTQFDSLIGNANAIRTMIGSEIIIVSNIIARNLVMFRTLVNTVAQLDIISRTLDQFRSVSNTILLSDNIIMGFGVVLSNTVVVSNIIARNLVMFRTLADTTTTNDVVVKVLNNLRLITESVLLPHFIVVQVGNFRTLTENTIISNIITRMLVMFRTITNNITIDDVGSPQIGAYRAISEGAIILSDFIVSSTGLFRVLTENVPNITFSNIVRNLILLRTFTENIVIDDPITRVRDVAHTLNETIVIPVEGLVRRLDQFRVFADNIILSELLIVNLVKFRALSETITTSDFIVRLQATYRTLVNTVVVSNIIARMLVMFRTMSESLVGEPIDVLVVGQQRFISESITVGAGQIVRLLVMFRTLTNNVVITDPMTGIANIFRALSEPSIAVSDIIGAIRDRLRSMTEAQVVVSDQLVRLLVMFRTLLNTIVIDDVGSPQIGNYRTIAEQAIVIPVEGIIRRLDQYRTLVNTVVVSDIISRLMVEFRTLTENITRNENVVRMLTMYRIINTGNTIILDDTISGIRTALRSMTEAQVVLSDDVVRMISLLRTVVNTVVLSDFITYNQEFYRTLLNTVVLSDIVDRVLSNIRTINESAINTMDSVVKILDTFRLITESVLLPHFVSRNLVMFRTFADNIVLSDLLNVGQFRIIADTITQSDQVIRMLTMYRILSDSRSAVDGVQNSVGNIRTVIGAEVISLSDDIVRLLAVFRVLTNNIVLSDMITYSQEFYRTLVNTIILNDNVVRMLTLLRTIANTVTTELDTMIVTSTRPADIIEGAVVLSDDIVRQIDLFRILNNFVNPLDSVKIKLFRTVVEPLLTPSAQLQRVYNAYRITTNPAISVFDVFARNIDVFRTLAETVITSEIFDRTAMLYRTVIGAEVIVLNDNVVRFVNAVGDIVETVIINDTVSRMLELFRIINDGAISVFDTLFGSAVVPVKFFFTTIIRPSIDFDTTIKESITFPTRVKLSVVFLTTIKDTMVFGTQIKDSMIFNTRLGMSDITWDTTIKDVIVFGTTIKDNLVFSTVIADTLEFMTRIRIYLNFITRIKESEGN